MKSWTLSFDFCRASAKSMIETFFFELTNWARKALCKSSCVWIDPSCNWVYQVNAKPLRDWTNCLINKASDKANSPHAE